MSEIIEINNLSKSFIISHEGNKERYATLRDAIAKKTKSIFSFASKSSSKSHSKEEFWALRDLSFSVEQGDRVGIIGRNGAGKSTLLKILSRITEPTIGSIKIKGRVASLLEVGTGFHPELTGRENIYLNGAILGMSRGEIKKKFDEIVSFAEVEKFLDTPVKRYSSGMYVRLAFGVAAHLEPEVLIVDEVLAVGDAQFQKKCLGKMEEVSKQGGRTVLFVSHQMDAIESLTQKCVYLKNGRCNQIGNTHDVVYHYLKDYQDSTDILNYKNRNGSGKAKIVKLEVLQGGQLVKMIKQGQKFDVVIGIQNHTTDLLDISFVLENYKELPLFCSQLSDGGVVERKGEYFEKRITVDVPYIRKGDYLVSMAVFRSDKTEFHDVVLHFPLISIDGIEEASFFPQDGRWGDLFFNLKWQ